MKHTVRKLDVCVVELEQHGAALPKLVFFLLNKIFINFGTSIAIVIARA
jgi:hypothetical protein